MSSGHSTVNHPLKKRKSGCDCKNKQVMSGGVNFDGSETIVSGAEDESLHKKRTELLLRVFQLELILDILKNIDANDLDVTDKEHLQKLIRMLYVQDCVRLSETDNVLGIETVDILPFTYTEKKAIRDYLFFKIREICSPVVEYVAKMQKKIPNVFELDANAKEILQLAEKRRTLHKQLIHMKNNKVELLKTCCEIKLEPHELKSLELLAAECKLNLIKVETLDKFLVQEFCTSTEFTLKAIRDVENYINDELKKYEQNA